MWPLDSAALASSLLFYFLLLCCNLHLSPLHCTIPYEAGLSISLLFFLATEFLCCVAHCESSTKFYCTLPLYYFLASWSLPLFYISTPCLLCSLPQDARLSSIRIDPTCPTTANIFSGKERSKAAALSLGGKVGSDLKSNQSDRKSLNSFEKRKVSGLELEMPRLFGLWNSLQKSKWMLHII